MLETTLQVQKDAPVDVLLGTDLLRRLGFSLVCTGGDGSSTDLLQPTREDTLPIDGEHPASSTQPEDRPRRPAQKPKEEMNHPEVTVHLIQEAHLPARHSRLIRAHHNASEASLQTCLFEPELAALQKKGLSMADALVEPGDPMVLVVTNQGTEPVQLEVGDVLGRLQPAVVVEEVCEVSGGEVSGGEVCGGEGSKKELRDSEAADQCVAAIQRADRLESSGAREDELWKLFGLSEKDLPSKQLEQLKEVVLTFDHLFALNSSELGCTSALTHQINTGDHPPVKQAPRRVPFALRGKVCQVVKEMLEQDVIQPSSSPWASPVVLVTKKDGSTRCCVEYRKLNSLTKMDVYPLPRIDDSLDLLAETQYFLSLDLASGYWQVGMDPDSREKTAFTTHAGLYEFTVMPFGLCAHYIPMTNGECAVRTCWGQMHHLPG